MRKKVWEDYVEELSYLFLLKGLDEPKFGKGKGLFVFRVKGGEMEEFRVIKGFRALKVFTGSEERGYGFFLSSRRSLWRIEMWFDPIYWLGFYLDFFEGYLKVKGLKMNSFMVNEGWLFLFREIGELRLKGLDYDYYKWGSTMRVFLKWKKKCPTKKEFRIFCSSLKLFSR